MKLQQVPGAQSCQDHCTNKHCIYMDFRSRAQLGKCCRNSCMSLFLTEGIQFQMTSNLFFLLKNPWGSTQYNYIMLTFLAEQGCQLTKTKMCILNEGGRILQDLFFFFTLGALCSAALEGRTNRSYTEEANFLLIQDLIQGFFFLNPPYHSHSNE